MPQLAIFSGVAAFGSLQSTSQFSTESVPVTQIYAGAPAVSAFNSGNISLTDDWSQSFGPIFPTFGGYFNVSNNGLNIVRSLTSAQPMTAMTLTAAATAVTYNLSLTSVTASTGSTYNGFAIYTGTITGGASNAFFGYEFTITGFTNGSNNGTFFCTASTATTLTLQNSAAVVETHAATAASATTQYTGTITGGASNSYAGCTSMLIGGFTNAGNNGTFTVVASSGTTLTVLNSGGVSETHAGTATVNGNLIFQGANIEVAVAPTGNPNFDDSLYVSGLSVNMITSQQLTTTSSPSSGVGITAIETENSVSLPAGNTSTVTIGQVVGLYTESLIGNFNNPDGVYNITDHWNYHCAGMGYVGHATGTITSSAGIFMEGPRVPTGCVLTSRYGIFMQPQNQNSGGTNTSAYGIWEASSTEKNQLGSIFLGSHMGLQGANNDFAGTLSIAGTTTVSKTFAANYTGTNAPVVIITPQFDIGASNRYWVTYSGGSGAWTGFTVNFDSSETGSVNYIVVGNPT